jgi:hypothetical protein
MCKTILYADAELELDGLLQQMAITREQGKSTTTDSSVLKSVNCVKDQQS